MTVRQRKKNIKPSSNSSIDHPKKTSDQVNISLFSTFIHWLWLEEDASFLGIFRIGWGLIMTWEAWLHIRNNFRVTKAHFYASKYGFHPKYFPFYWVDKIDYNYMQIFLIILLISAICITIGLKYKISCIYFFFGISYLFLLDKIHHLNHMYLVCIISFIMIFMPCNIVYSIDNRKHSKTATVPKIYLVFIRTFLIVVYTYAGIVKINEDWLRAEPLRHWIGKKPFTAFGPLLNYEISAYIFSYGGLFYDLFVGLLLLWNKTFWIGILATLFFHISNKLLFNIGIFPYIMIASTSLFFRPDYPRKLFHKLFNRKKPYKSLAQTDVLLSSYKVKKKRKFTLKQKLITIGFFIFLIWWILNPVRYYFLPCNGPQVWTECSHEWSWRMKLRDRDCIGEFFGVFPESKDIFYVPSYPEHEMVTKKQRNKIPNRPSLIIQYAHFLADLYATEEEGKPEIYGYCDCSINYRPFQPYTNRTVDLASEPIWDYHDWILPLSPLPEEYSSQYPWNWTFDSDWWETMFRHNLNHIIYEMKITRNEIKEDIKAKNREDFIEYIANRFYNSDKSQVILDKKLPPKSKRVQRFR